MGTPISNALTAAAAPAADAAGAAEGAAGGGGGRRGCDGVRVRGSLGGLAGLGEAASVGGLSVPPKLGLGRDSSGGDAGGGSDAGSCWRLRAPISAPDWVSHSCSPPGGLGRAAAAGAGAVAGAAAPKYLPRLNVVARSPAAGYAAESGILVNREISGARRIPDKRTRAPGYPPAIVYLPTNGHEPANVDR